MCSDKQNPDEDQQIITWPRINLYDPDADITKTFTEKKKCDCGAEKANVPFHASWCSTQEDNK